MGRAASEGAPLVWAGAVLGGAALAELLVLAGAAEFSALAGAAEVGVLVARAAGEALPGFLLPVP